MWTAELLLTLLLIHSALSAEIVVHPTDVTLSEGDAVNMTCKTDFQPYNCKWMIYRDDNTDRMSEVSDFSPVRNYDCSISIKQVKHVHVGKWICRAKTGWIGGYVNSKPASVVIATEPQQPQHPLLSNRPRNVTAILGEPLVINCSADVQLSRCGWLMPDGIFLPIDTSSSESPASSGWQDPLRPIGIDFLGSLFGGDCSVRLTELLTRHLGAWSCLMEVDDTAIWTAPAYITANALPRAARARGDDAKVGEQPVGLGQPTILFLVVASLAIIASIIFFSVVFHRRSRSSDQSDDDVYADDAEDDEEGMTFRIRNMRQMADTEDDGGDAKRTKKEADGIANKRNETRAQPNIYVTKGQLTELKQPGHVYSNIQQDVISGQMGPGDVYDSPRQGSGESPAWTLRLADEDGEMNEAGGSTENIYAVIGEGKLQK